MKYIRSLKEMVSNSYEILQCYPSEHFSDKNFKMAWDMLSEESCDKIILISVLMRLKNRFNLTDFEIELMIEEAV